MVDERDAEASDDDVGVLVEDGIHLCDGRGFFNHDAHSAEACLFHCRLLWLCLYQTEKAALPIQEGRFYDSETSEACPACPLGTSLR